MSGNHRVAFTKGLVEMASLEENVDPSDLLILHEEVGTLQSAQDSSIQCAVFQLKLTSSSSKFTLSIMHIASSQFFNVAR